MKKGGNSHLNADKGGVNILGYRQKHKSARARTRNYNFECDWLIELSDNKLSNNKLSNNKLYFFPRGHSNVSCNLIGS